jgi:enterochelin esterase family protein
MKQFFSILVLACCTVPVMAQWQMQPTPNDTLQPVRNLGGGKVAFSIYAPNAQQVGFGGDAMPWGKPLQFTKSDNGVWTAVISDLKDGVYRYNFTVDGVKVQDPKGALSAETSALANIGDGKQFYDMRQDVPHGAIAQRYYFSKPLNTLRRLHVWTPAGYEKSSEKLPVLYLIHGGGDNDASWPGVGCACNILDNLLAEGKMKPMVVVMPNGSIPVKNMMDEVPLFENDLVTSIIPYIEDNYRVYTDKAHRAMAGLSMGGMETMETILNDNDKFEYFWVLSAGWFPAQKEQFEGYRQRLHKAAAGVKKNVRQLVFTQGDPEDIAYQNGLATLKLFDAAGIKYEYYTAPGGHTWYTWRNNLHQLAQRLFK